jgi:CheY-like chemotaxis protein
VAEAINKLELEHDLPSVVLLDMRTPVMNGTELAATLKAHPAYKEIPILAAGGHFGGLTRDRCLALGCDDFIAKPFAFLDLEMRLTNILSVQRLKTIRATDPMNLEFKRRERTLRAPAFEE